ncbi:MAG: DUF981 family protein [Thermoplasmataceae archaeon]
MFIDNLGIEILSLSTVAMLVLYVTAEMYLRYRKGMKNVYDTEVPGTMPLFILGLYITLSGFWGQLTWPLPGSYNILFYDPYTVLGIIILSGAISVFRKTRVQYVGFLSLLAGFMTIFYGYEAYVLHMTSSPFNTMLMYVFFGVTAIFAYPVSLLVDHVDHESMDNKIWMGFLVIFWIMLLASALMAGYVGFTAIGSHLLKTP